HPMRVQAIQCGDPSRPDREAHDHRQQQAGVMRCERDAERRDLEQSWIHTPALPARAQACVLRALRPADVAGLAGLASGKAAADTCPIAEVGGRTEVVVVTRTVHGLELAGGAAAVSVHRVAVVTLLAWLHLPVAASGAVGLVGADGTTRMAGAWTHKPTLVKV